MKIDADDNDGHGSRLLLRHMEQAPFTLHSLAIQTMSDFYVFYSFTLECGATTLPIKTAPPIGPPSTREGRQRPSICDFPSGFWREILTRKARNRNPAPLRRPCRLPPKRKMAQAALLAGGRDHPRRPDRYCAIPRTSQLATLQRLRQRARLLVGEPPCPPSRSKWPGQARRGWKEISTRRLPLSLSPREQPLRSWGKSLGVCSSGSAITENGVCQSTLL